MVEAVEADQRRLALVKYIFLWASRAREGQHQLGVASGRLFFEFSFFRHHFLTYPMNDRSAGPCAFSLSTDDLAARRAGPIATEPLLLK